MTAADLLKKNNLKVTKSRLLILKTVMDFRKPFTVPELLSIENVQGVDPVTIYRNISLFTTSKILKELSLRTGVIHYELDTGHTHHHIVCNTCGYLEPIFTCEAQSISEKVLRESKHFISINKHSFELFGLCMNCYENKK
jgi:Fe2+ or Zn2+ uptake regulation protein